MTKKGIIFIGILISALSFGQKKEELQKQNATLKKQITEINKELAKTQQQSKLSIAYLENVNKKIQLREKVYNNTQKEKRFIEDEIYLRQLEINRQNRELQVLRKNYAEVLVNAYKSKGVQNKVTFILSASNLGQAIRRVQYLKQYGDYQQRKSNEIKEAAENLKKAVAAKEKSVTDKQNLLVNQEKDLKTIDAERKQKEILLADFKRNEQNLTSELKQKQQESKKLEGQIRAIIAEEIRIAKAKEAAEAKERAERLRIAKEAAAREKARIDAENKAKADALERERRIAEENARKANELAAKKAAEERKRAEDAAKADANARDIARREAATKEAAIAAAKAKEAADKYAAAKAAEAELNRKKEEEKIKAENKVLTNFDVAPSLSSSFVASKGKMQMPVRGQITHRFGRQAHPVFKNIIEENNGIKIAVTKGSIARSIFPGVVSRVISSADGTKTVMVKHGDYFSVYANLANTAVSQGQSVAAGTPIGGIAQDFDGSYTLDFQIWNSSGNAVDPLGWVN